MPSRGSYTLTRTEEQKAVQNDQSYRSCVIALLIFFLLCIVLILATVPWKKSHRNYDSHATRDTVETAGFGGKVFANEEPHMEVEIDTNDDYTTITEDESSTKTSELPIKSEDPSDSRRNNSSTDRSSTQVLVEEVISQRYINNVTTESSESTTTQKSTFDDDGTYIDNVTQSGTLTHSRLTLTSDEPLVSDLNDTSTDLPVNNFTTVSPEYLQSIEDQNYTVTATSFKSSTHPEIQQVSSDPTTFPRAVFDQTLISDAGQTTTEINPELSTSVGYSTGSAGYTSLKKLIVAKYFGNESATTESEDSEVDWLAKSEYSLANDKSTESTNQWAYTTAISSSKGSMSSTQSERIAQYPTTTPNSLVDHSAIEEKDVKKEINVCTTGRCKQTASRLLSYMNHSADPCDDFYEYACGGFEADPHIIETDLSTSVYETIYRQAKRHKNHPELGKFNVYYDSCIKYEARYSSKSRNDLAWDALKSVGQFYTSANWLDGSPDFTQLFANMLLHDRPLLFDIAPDINGTHTNTFTLRIGPTVDNKLFQFSNEPDSCDTESEKFNENFVNLDELYNEYRNCKNDMKNFVAFIELILKELGIFENPPIDHDLIRAILSMYPPESEIREAYRSKKYSVFTLHTLQENFKLLDWIQLISSLTGGSLLGPDTQVQIYCADHIMKALRYLGEVQIHRPRELNNALLGLYARNLYQDFVSSRSASNLHKHCLSLATHYMKCEASELYMSSFTESQLKNMDFMMRDLFRNLKETLKEEIAESTWTSNWGRQVLLKKLSDTKMFLPHTTKSDVDYEVSNLNITDNYFKNSMDLMKKYRSMMYSVKDKNPGHSRQIWTFFAAPFDWTPRMIYGINLIVFPFGAVDWSAMSITEQTFEYLTQARIGSLIAREIAHNFDLNGIRYWNGSQDSEFALLTDDDETKNIYDDYIDCHRSLYHQPMEMSLPITGQSVNFTIPPQSLNERLSDAVGMRLASDTLARLGSAATKERLPWLDLDVSQLFYLAYAQTFCTKTPLSTSYVSMYEDALLPNQIRVFVIASNDKLLSEAWRCAEGSKISPGVMCEAFPHLSNSDGGIESA